MYSTIYLTILRMKIFRYSIAVALIVVIVLVASNCAGEAEKRQVPELRKIAAQTPLYPGFQKIGEKVVLKRGMVYFFTTYTSNAEFIEIKKFYDEVMKENGWGPPQQPAPSTFVGDKHLVTYRRGDYVIVVEQDGSLRDHFDICF